MKNDNLRKLIKQLDARIDDMKAEINYKSWESDEIKTIIAYNMVLIENIISKIKGELNE